LSDVGSERACLRDSGRRKIEQHQNKERGKELESSSVTVIHPEQISHVQLASLELGRPGAGTVQHRALNPTIPMPLGTIQGFPPRLADPRTREGWQYGKLSTLPPEDARANAIRSHESDLACLRACTHFSFTDNDPVALPLRPD